MDTVAKTNCLNIYLLEEMNTSTKTRDCLPFLVFDDIQFSVTIESIV